MLGRIIQAGILVLSVSSLLFAQGLPKVEPGEAGFSPERLERLRSALQESVDGKEFAGINVAIARDGKLAYFGSFGYQDLEGGKPMRPDTIFRIFSMTKAITCTAVMMLYEEGKFLLDDPVSKYIPEYSSMQVLKTEDGDGSETAPLARALTIHHLLTHTSGLFNSKAYRDQKVFSGSANLEEMSRRLAAVPLSHQPGEAWRYGQSMDLLARLVEIWSGKPFAEFLEERIFRPLEMPDTAHYVPEEKLDRLAKTYQLTEGGQLQPGGPQNVPTQKPAYTAGGAGLYSTTGDYLRFCQMLLNRGTLDGKRLLGPHTVNFMMLNHVPMDVLPPDGPNNRKGYGYGLAGAVLMNPASSEVLSAEGEFNWGGAAGTLFWVDYRNRVVGIWMVQRPPFVAPPSKRFKVLTYQALEK